MEFNIWTLIFQLINFFVLLFILKRLLYRPVREIMEKRRAVVRKTLDDAERTKAEALALKAEYDARGADIDRLRNEALEKAEDEAAALRKETVKKAEEEAAVIFEKETARLEVERRKAQSEFKNAVIRSSLSYASSILTDLSDENLHERIIEKLSEEIPGMAGETKGLARDGLTVEISSAYPLPDSFVEKVRTQFGSATLKNVEVATGIDRGLISGAVIRVLGTVYDASLKGQLKAFEQKLKRLE